MNNKEVMQMRKTTNNENCKSGKNYNKQLFSEKIISEKKRKHNSNG